MLDSLHKRCSRALSKVSVWPRAGRAHEPAAAGRAPKSPVLIAIFVTFFLTMILSNSIESA